MGYGSGGHARSGPPRDPNALSRPGTPAQNGWTQLTNPTEHAPAWPLLDPATPAEAAIWRDLWSRPQSTAWPKFNLIREVAVYARCLAEFEAPGKTNAALGGLVRKQADDLGLTIVGAERNRWLMPKQQVAASVTALPGGRTRSSAKDEFTQVNAGRPTSRDRFRRVSAPTATDDPAPF